MGVTLLEEPSVKVEQQEYREIDVLPRPKIQHFTIDEFPIGILSDVHGKLSNVTAAIEKHPEIKQWFCLGDLVDYADRFKGNENTLGWWRECDVPTLRGNHDRDIANACRTSAYNIDWIRTLPRSFKLIFPDCSTLLCYHSLPNDDITFVEPHITEREFVDQYPIDEDTRAVVIGHNHKQFKSVFPYCTAELWSVGSIGFGGNYAIIDNSGIQFHRVPSVNSHIK